VALANRALVVGINCYPAIGDLQGAEADAQDFYNWVTSPAGGAVHAANAKLILSIPPTSGKAQDAAPGRYQIEAFFRDIDDAANENNDSGSGLQAGQRLWLFFSGHGFAPSFDRSALLVANTTKTALDNFACRLWADRLFQGGWFKEVVLFQDACRNRFNAGTLMPSFLEQRDSPGAARFYALAAQDGKLALEKPDGTGRVRGVFTLTLMEALRGLARDPISGAITSSGLMAYLQSNMRAKYTQQEQQNDDYAQVPDVYAPVPFDVMPGAGGAVVPRKFPVRVTLPAGNLPAAILNGSLQKIAENPAAETWDLTLPIGLYQLSAVGGVEKTFKVTGAVKADGTEERVDV
jgi:uncharacterized caspase-like protein